MTRTRAIVSGEAHEVHACGTIADVADHIDAARCVVGVEHVGVGSDFDGGITLPHPMHDAGDLVVLTDELLRRGYTPEECIAILGANALRGLDSVSSGA